MTCPTCQSDDPCRTESLWYKQHGECHDDFHIDADLDCLHWGREDWEAHEAAQLDEIESEEAEEARWSSLMKRAAAERQPVHYPKAGIDRRLFDVSGMRSMS